MAPASSTLITTTSKPNFKAETGYGYSGFGCPRVVAMRPGPCSFSTRAFYSVSAATSKPKYAVSSSLVSSSTCPQQIERTQLHTLSVFGGDDDDDDDDSGTLINRIAGIFGRRLHNIDSVSLGFINNRHNGLFTVVLVFPATPTVFQQLLAHLNNLPNVLKVEDISTEPQVERELMLIKLSVDPATRDAIMWLVNIFRARVVDTSESYMTIEVSGDPGKLAVILRNVGKFGIKEITRTGKIALRRERMGDCRSLYQGLMENVVKMPVDATKESSSRTISPSNSDRVRSHTICMVVSDAPGVLNRVTGVICSRGYKIQSLAVGQAEKEGLSRITAVVPGTNGSIAKLARRLHKLTDLHEIEDVSHVPCVERELMLIKIATNTTTRRDILDISNIFRAEAVDLSDHSITLQLTGDINKMIALQNLLEPYDICEVARTGRVALVRESGVNSTYLRG